MCRAFACLYYSTKKTFIIYENITRKTPKFGLGDSFVLHGAASGENQYGATVFDQAASSVLDCGGTGDTVRGD